MTTTTKGRDLFLAACAPAATPTPSPKPTSPAPAAAAPTVAPSPAPTLPQAKPTLAPTVAPATPVPQARPPAEEKPRSGGVLTALNNTDLPHMDMLQQTTSKMQNPLSVAYNLLISRDPQDETKLVPDLAERWEMSPDGKTYTFYLRRDVKWHDGKPFTSADIKATFERMMGKVATVFSPRQEWWTPIEKVETPDSYTVKFTMKHPFASFLGMVADPYNFMFPKHVMEAKGDMKREVVGTGPFKFKQYIGGVSFELARNPDYHIKDRPFLDGMVWYIVKDASAQYAAIRTGQVKMELVINHAVPRSLQ